jgi:hypothetical protein
MQLPWLGLSLSEIRHGSLALDPGDRAGRYQ